MAKWVKCTRKADSAPIYLNLEAAMTLRWNDAEAFTVVALPGGNENHMRVLEHPDDLFNRGWVIRRNECERKRQIEAVE